MRSNDLYTTTKACNKLRTKKRKRNKLAYQILDTMVQEYKYIKNGANQFLNTILIAVQCD